jgi:hypothetical protein
MRKPPFNLIGGEEISEICARRGQCLRNDGHSWEFFNTYGFRVNALEDGEQLHVSMLHVLFDPWQLTRPNSQEDV